MDSAGDVYSHGHDESVLRSHRWRTAENSAGYLLHRLRPTDAVLDVGCGPGTITLDLASRVSSGRVVGLDNAPQAVEAARQQAQRRDSSSVESDSSSVDVSSVEFSLGDVYALDFPSASFDVVHAHQVLQHLRDPVAALVEMKRVCKPGGLVAVRDADYSAMTWFPESDGLTHWLDLYRAVARGNGGEPDAGRRLRSWAVAAGFRSVETSGSLWCFANDADVSWWSDTWARRITDSSIAEQARERGLADSDELRDLAQAWRDWASQPDAWFAIVHGEVLGTV